MNNSVKFWYAYVTSLVILAVSGAFYFEKGSAESLFFLIYSGGACVGFIFLYLGEVIKEVSRK